MHLTLTCWREARFQMLRIGSCSLMIAYFIRIDNKDISDCLTLLFLVLQKFEKNQTPTN